MGHTDRDPTEIPTRGPTGLPTEIPTGIPAAADVALAPVLHGPVRTARVVAVTPVAVYLELDGGEVVALLGPGAVRVPNALAVAGGWSAIAVSMAAGSPVRVGAGTVSVGDVGIRPGRWYDALVPRVRVGAATATRARVAELGLPPLPGAVAAAAGAFSAALADGDAGRLALAVRGLVGLGPGLTPAGDDVLAGALVALAATGGDAAALDRFVAPVRPRTTIVSAALLRCAAAGRAVPALARFVVAAATDRLQPAMVQDLVRVGSTSGTALAHGALAGLGARAREVA